MIRPCKFKTMWKIFARASRDYFRGRLWPNEQEYKIKPVIATRIRSQGSDI